MKEPCIFCGKLQGLAALGPDDVIWETPTSVALLGPWQYYRGYSILVARAHATELHHLSADHRDRYVDDLCRLAAAIEAEFRPRKLNYELLGNQAPHLHWHLFPRFDADPNHLQAVWLDIARAEADPAIRERLIASPLDKTETAHRLRRRLAGGPGATS